jgi:senataxin
VLNSLHIRQYNKYYEEVRRIAALPTGARSAALELARKAKPRLLCCAPSNTAVDNIILKIMEDGFIDGQGQRYNPSVIRVGVGQSANVRAVALETKVDAILSEHMDAGKLESSIAGYRSELSRITSDIALLRQKCNAIVSACPWPLSRDWEIRINEARFDTKKGVFFVNHKDQTTSYEVPPTPEPGETQFPAKSMPEYRAYMARIVKLVENYFSVKTHLERCTIVKGATDNGANHFEIQQNMENHVLNSVHIVLTTLGSAGGRAMEGIDKFEVVVIDEAAQSVEPQSLSALQLGNRHAVLVGDPQQLPATIFSVSGKTTKYDRSLFQRLEEAGELVYMLNEQYRMHPKISHFPRHIFYDGTLLDGPNVRKDGYGNPLLGVVRTAAPSFQPFTILDLDSAEQRDGTSLANPDEARLAVHLYLQLTELSRGLSNKTRVAVITPYAQQSRLLQRFFENALGPEYKSLVEVNTVDAFQGREANIVIFSAVRGSGSQGIGFLADVRRMNVALTRAKHMLFVIARCQSIVVNPYWHDLVDHAKETKAVIRVPFTGSGNNLSFGPVNNWVGELPAATTVRPVAVDPRRAKSTAMKLPRADPRKAAATKSAFQASEAIQRSGDGAETTALHRPRADPRKAVTSKQAAKASGVAGSCDPRIKTKEAATAAVNVAKPRDPRMKTIVSEGRKRTAPVPSSSKPVDPRKRGRGYQL